MINFLQKSFNRLNTIIQYPELIPTLYKKINHGFCKDLLFLKKELGYNFYTILDIGASIGDYSKEANFIFPNSSIYAFEPISASFEKLKVL